MAEWLRQAWNSEYQHKVVVTYLFLLYIALFLILSTFYEEVHNQDLVILSSLCEYGKNLSYQWGGSTQLKGDLGRTKY